MKQLDFFLHKSKHYFSLYTENSKLSHLLISSEESDRWIGEGAAAYMGAAVLHSYSDI